MARSGFDGSVFAIVQALLKSLQLETFEARSKIDLSRRCSTQSHGVIDHGLYIHRNIPLTFSMWYERAVSV